MAEILGHSIPQVNQLEELRELLRETLFITGKSVATHPIYEEYKGKLRAKYVETERYLLGSLTEYSEPKLSDPMKEVMVLRERAYTGMYRSVGYGAALLCIAENDTVRNKIDAEHGGDSYQTLRNLYMFKWDGLVGVYESRVRKIEIVSRTNVEAEVLPRTEFDAPDKLLLNNEEADQALRFDLGWNSVTDGDIDALMHRTAEFGDDLVASLNK